MGITTTQSKKNLNVELNLLPIFDVLSVCICFLLMTVVWIDIRALETKQALGSAATATTDEESSLWIRVDAARNLVLSVKSKGHHDTSRSLPNLAGQIDFAGAQRSLAEASRDQIGTLHVLPDRTTKYDEVIRLMDASKVAGIKNIGLTPL